MFSVEASLDIYLGCEENGSIKTNKNISIEEMYCRAVKHFTWEAIEKWIGEFSSSDCHSSVGHVEHKLSHPDICETSMVQYQDRYGSKGGDNNIAPSRMLII